MSEPHYSSSSSVEAGEYHTSITIDKTNYVLGCCYVLLGGLSFIQALLKYRIERKLKTNVVFPTEICILSIVRAAYFFASITTWANQTPKYENSYMFFVDTIPELIFVAIYLLLVASWGVTWAKARKARPFSPRQFWLAYSVVVASTFFITIFLSFLAGQLHISYEQMVHWEGAYLVSLSCACVVAALIFGLRLYHMLKQTLAKSRYLSHVMRQLLLLVFLATASFALKGAWVFSISAFVRSKWVSGEWDDVQFGIFWFFYYFITEILPFQLIWLVLQRKETNEKALNHRSTRSTIRSVFTKEEGGSVDVELLGEKNLSLNSNSLNTSNEYAYSDASQLDKM